MDSHDDCAKETEVHSVDIFDFLRFGMVARVDFFICDCIFKISIPF
jgi:hypothetical protein